MAAECTLAECLDFFDDVLTTLRARFQAIEDVAPKPSLRVRSGHVELRYDNPTIELALFLKLARSISLLGALRVLVERGMVQEQGILQRAIDETDQDVLFLAWGQQNGLEEIHREFLDAFWAEEFDDPNFTLGHKRRASVPRRKIQAYNNRQLGVSDPSTAHSVDRLIQGVYSGYVHGASVHILDMYDTEARRFGVAGIRNTPVRQSYIVDSMNYPFRVLATSVIVARKLGLQAIADALDLKRKEAERVIRVPDDEEAAELMARMKSR